MKKNYFTISFYNLENLFDTKDDKYTNDDAFLPHAERNWNERRYRKKLKKLGKVISQIGTKKSHFPPAVVGLAEVENKQVVQDLIQTKYLRDHNYEVVHYDSSDERGIDCALIFRKEICELMDSTTHPVLLFDEKGERDFTRDILEATLKVNDEPLTFLVNHWSSRREGERETNHKRVAAAEKVIEIIKEKTTDDKILIMGDFNDDPTSESIQLLKSELDVYNPMDQLKSYDRGSLNHRHQWNLFDQILFTTNFFEIKSGAHHFSEANIFDKAFLKQYKGKYKGSPFRTYVGKRYKGGYSDHFPVYLHLKLKT